MVRGEEVDWSAPTPHVGDDRADVFRASADGLLDAWRDVGDGDAPTGADWQSAEIAVHTYDLAAALGRPTSDLDAAVAERGLAFMRASLTSESAASTSASDNAPRPRSLSKASERRCCRLSNIQAPKHERPRGRACAAWGRAHHQGLGVDPARLRSRR